jgi:predicted double-glycine peptidase
LNFPAGSGYAANFNVNGILLKKDVKPMREIKRSNLVTQSLDFSCGAAGLSTLLNFYLGENVSEQEIIERLLNTVPLEKVKARRGFSLYDLKTFAEERGYKVTGYQMDFEFLRALKTPVLVPIQFRKYSHFVIVRGVVGDRVFIADPAAGNMSMKIDKFKRMWGNGIGLVVESLHQDENAQYALKIKEDDLLITDYKYLTRLIDQGMIRTSVFPSEF